MQKGNDNEGINFAASLVGDPQRMDENTKHRSRLDYARVCVFISADQELPTAIQVGMGRVPSSRLTMNGSRQCVRNVKFLGIAQHRAQQEPQGLGYQMKEETREMIHLNRMKRITSLLIRETHGSF